MCRFVVKVVYFLILIITVIVLLISTVNYAVSRDKYYKIPKDRTILIVGHSHSECSYNTEYIKNAINTSQSGEQYLYTYIKTKKIIKANPQIENVLVEFTYNVLDEENVKKIWTDSHIQNRHPIYSQLFSLEEYFYFLKYNFKQEIIVEGKSLRNKMEFLIKSRQKIENNKDFGGYKKLNENKLSSNNQIKIKELSKLNINYLIKLIEFCNRNKIRISLIRSPLHEKYEYGGNEDLFIEVKNKYFKDVKFIDFKDYDLMDEDYADYGHLNYKGAEKISKYLDKILISNLE